MKDLNYQKSIPDSKESMSVETGVVSKKVVDSCQSFFFLAGGESLFLGAGCFLVAFLDKCFGQSNENYF